jgi:hypothetical protein
LSLFDVERVLERKKWQKHTALYTPSTVCQYPIPPPQIEASCPGI